MLKFLNTPDADAGIMGEKASASQKAYTIGGVPILFPFKAYPSQISMMDKIIKCLNKKHNCLLESPTGSGKSLALLCSTLAWLRKTEKEIQEMQQKLEDHLDSSTASAYHNECYSRQNYQTATNFDQFRYKCAEHKSNYTKSNNSEKPTVSETIQEKTIKSELLTDDLKESSASPDVICLGSTKLNSPLVKYETDVSSNDMCCIKRGITYIDDEDENDFQPIKKSKRLSCIKDKCNVLASDKNLQIQPPSELKKQDVVNSPIKQSKYEKEINIDGKTIVEKNFGTEIDNSLNIGKNIKHENLTTTKSKETQNANLPPTLPKIYFGTRTHKQIEQIIRELKRTPYKDVKMTILSSREKTCIHPKNSKCSNKNEGCDELIRRDEGPACEFFRNAKKISYSLSSEISTAFDLEDFVTICRRRRICPYFGARDLLLSSEIIFCPYNYLIDPLIRSSLSINLKGSIVIMDEAHNIEDSAREAGSQSFTLSQLREAVSDIFQVMQSKKEDNEHYIHIAKVLENFKKWLDQSEDLNDYVSFNSSAKVWGGNDMIAVLDYVGLGPDTFPNFHAYYAKILKEESEVEKEIDHELHILKLSGSTHTCLKSLVVLFNYMYKENLQFMADYRCVVVKCKAHADDTSIILPSQSFKRKSFSVVYEKTVNFWCLNPAVAFTDVKDIIHSLIVASGTLAPLGSFQSELGIPFQITLEANHVVSNENLWVGTIGRGPNNSCLSGTFHNALTFAFQDEIGHVIYEVCSIIRHGILCFLPSYGMLDKLVNRWKLTGLWDKLISLKIVVCEPRRGKDNFQQVMNEFYEAIKDSEENSNDTLKGALFFAVCRGKVSEGLDFSDNNARAVITVGIPFPNIKDAQVDLKKKYNDIYSSKRPIVTGSEWYEMQAFRAINQALGRCIRHRNDYGALIIVDERFQKYDRYNGALSKWIKKEVEHYSTFCGAINSLSKFAEKMGLNNSKEK